MTVELSKNTYGFAEPWEQSSTKVEGLPQERQRSLRVDELIVLRFRSEFFAKPPSPKLESSQKLEPLSSGEAARLILGQRVKDCFAGICKSTSSTQIPEMSPKKVSPPSVVQRAPSPLSAQQ